MATVTASILTTDPVVSNTSPIRVRLQFSEGFSFSHSDITVLNGRNIRLTQVGQSQVSYYREYWFLTQTHENAPGYARFFLAADAVTPNLDEDLDFFIYWDSDLEANISLASTLPDGAISIPEITRLWWLGPVSGGALVDVRMTLSHDARFFDANDFTVTGDATGVDSTAVYGGNDYWLLRVRLPSSLGNGGSFRMVLNDIHACYPSISQTFDRTFRWNSSGYVSSINTADIPAVLTMSISETYIAISEDLTVTFDFDIDVTNFTASDVSVTTGITKGTFTEVSARQYTLVITTPASGNGEGVVSLARNRVTPGNNNASVRFTYIDRIDADISLSAAAAQNGETVLVQFDFDYDVPNFESSFLTLSDPGATAREATSLDDENRCWVVPVTLPQQGEGDLEISLEEDEIGFGQDRVAGQVQFAPTIRLNIALRDNLTLLPIINRDFKHDINITGNNIRTVDVQGLLRPFYHQWNASTGILSILGKPEVYYKDLEFEVIAVDRDGTETASAKINVIDIMPVIVAPSNPIEVLGGRTNEAEIVIMNNPSQVDVEGSWIGLDHSLSENGVMISGTVPRENLGISSGNLTVVAENSGGKTGEVSVPWNVTTPPFKLHSRNSGPRGLAYDTVNDEILCLDSRHWYRYDLNGAHLGTVALNNSNSFPADISFDPVNNKVLVLNFRTSIFSYNLDGSASGFSELRTGSAFNHSPAGITVSGGTDQIVVSDSGLFRSLYHYGLASRLYTFRREVNLHTTTISKLAYNSEDDEILAIDASADVIRRFEINSNYLGEHSLSRSRTSSDSNNQYPQDIAYNSTDDEILVSDRLPHIFRYDPNGTFLNKRTLSGSFSSGNDYVGIAFNDDDDEIIMVAYNVLLLEVR